MSFAISVKKIHCTNCGYEGNSKIKGTGGPYMILMLLSVIAGVFYSFFWALAFLFLCISIFVPAKHICPKCKWENTIALNKKNNTIQEKQTEENNSKKCPFCAESIKSEAIICRFCGKDIPVKEETNN